MVLLIKDALCIHFKQTLLISLPIIFYFVWSVSPAGTSHQLLLIQSASLSALFIVELVYDLRKQTVALFGEKKNLIMVVK